MKIIYRIVSELFLLVSPLVILYRILKNKEDKRRFLERYGINSKKRNKGKLIWFHCSSVGELLSLIPLIENLETNNKVKQILVTTTTLSSSKIFYKLNLKKTIHQFFPIDNVFIINKFISYWNPSVFFLCESEIWPNLINKISEQGIKLVLINGRMTKKTFKRWKRISNFSNNVFKKFDLCLIQNKETGRRLKILGANNILNFGNLKFSTRKKVKSDLLESKKLKFFKNKKIIITAASTHPNEESFIIQNHLNLKLKKKIKNIISIIIPRHIERVNDIQNEIEKFSLKTHLHSWNKKIDENIDIYIVDTYGELNKFYRISNLVFMGGSLIIHGGQNPLEPAKLGCKIIYGPYISNFSEIYKKLDKMNISRKFISYNSGFKIIEKNHNKIKLNFNNKNLTNYGKKVLNLTFSEIKKLI